MSSYQKERDEFIGVIVDELLFRTPGDSRTNNNAVSLARLILRNSATIQRCEERVCSSEAADRDRVPCPAIKSGRDEDCACEQYKWTAWTTSGKAHQCETQEAAEAKVKSLREAGIFARVSKHSPTPRVQVEILRARQRIEKACAPWGIKPDFSGDPRGACVKLILPSGRWNSFGGAESGYCVPTR